MARADKLIDIMAGGAYMSGNFSVRAVPLENGFGTAVRGEQQVHRQ